MEKLHVGLCNVTSDFASLQQHTKVSILTYVPKHIVLFLTIIFLFDNFMYAQCA